MVIIHRVVTGLGVLISPPFPINFRPFWKMHLHRVVSSWNFSSMAPETSRKENEDIVALALSAFIRS